jgi:hypothetical protein
MERRWEAFTAHGGREALPKVRLVRSIAIINDNCLTIPIQPER